MRKSPWLFSLIAGALVMAGVGAAPAAEFDKVIEARQALMKDIGAANKAMRSAAGAAAVADAADKLAELLAGINADAFPKGSSDGSRARPEIWEQWDEFAAVAGKAVALARSIADKARAGENTAELIKGFGRSACGSCHRPFRKPKERG